MKIMLNSSDLSKLKAGTVEDIFSLIERPNASKSQAADAGSKGYNPWADPDFDWDDVADLSINQIQHFMETVSEPIAEALEYIATHGPSVPGQELIENTDISALNAFQGATTKRTRTITKIEDAKLLGWDSWSNAEKYPDGVGRYGVTEVTFNSLRRHFGIE